MRKIQIQWLENREVAGIETAAFRVDGEWKSEGVYVIKVDGQVEYIGQTGNFQRRINDGYGHMCPANFAPNGRRTNVAVNAKIVEAKKQGQMVEFFFGKVEERKSVEIVMINATHPAWNKI